MAKIMEEIIWGEPWTAAKEAERAQFLEEAAAKITPNARPFSALEGYLTQKYHAVLDDASPAARSKLASMKANILINRFPELLASGQGENEAQPRDPFADFDRARAYPAEKAGLVLKCYRIAGERDTFVCLELRTQSSMISDGSQALAEDLTLFLSVTAEDIACRNERFACYADALRAAGRL